MSNEPPAGHETPHAKGPPSPGGPRRAGQGSREGTGPAAAERAGGTPGRDGAAPSGWGRLARAAATALGGVSLVGGLTWLLLNLHAPEPSVDVAVGAVLALGGLALLLPHRLRLPHVATWIAAAVAAIGGTAAGLTAGSTAVCCMFAYVEGRGFPFRWLWRGGVADDPAVAQPLALSSGWDVDVASLAVGVVVWAHAGVVLVALVVLIRRAVQQRGQ